MEQRQKMLLFKLLLSLLLLLLLLLLSSFVKTADPSGIPQQAFPYLWKRTNERRGNEVLDKLFLIVVEAIDFLNFELCMAVSWV